VVRRLHLVDRAVKIDGPFGGIFLSGYTTSAGPDVPGHHGVRQKGQPVNRSGHGIAPGKVHVDSVPPPALQDGRRGQFDSNQPEHGEGTDYDGVDVLVLLLSLLHPVNGELGRLPNDKQHQRHLEEFGIPTAQSCLQVRDPHRTEQGAGQEDEREVKDGQLKDLR